MPLLTLTDRSVAELGFHPGKQVEYRDVDLAGFFVRVGSRTKTYMAQGDMSKNGIRASIKIKLGASSDMTSREARARAKHLLGQIQSGIDPRPKSASALVEGLLVTPTLRSAWSSYLESHLNRKGRSENTIADYRDHVERLMAEWLETPLRELGEAPVKAKLKHDEITASNGPYIANSCMRTLRAIYNHARKTARDLPADNPVLAVDWNPESRRDTAMGPEDLPRWSKQLRVLDNPIRRELHLLLLLSGSRPDPIKKARLEHVDFVKRLLFIPQPKGGDAKAFCIPLSRQMIRCIVRAMRFGRMMHPIEAKTWLFPAESAAGHISEHKEDRAVLAYRGNDLRQSYRTIGQCAGVGDIDMHLLMNHSLPGVNAGYITRAKLMHSHLRGVQQQISDMIFDGIEAGGDTSRAWPWASGSSLLRFEFPDRVDVERGKGAQRVCRNMAIFRKQTSPTF